MDAPAVLTSPRFCFSSASSCVSYNDRTAHTQPSLQHAAIEHNRIKQSVQQETTTELVQWITGLLAMWHYLWNTDIKDEEQRDLTSLLKKKQAREKESLEAGGGALNEEKSTQWHNRWESRPFSLKNPNITQRSHLILHFKSGLPVSIEDVTPTLYITTTVKCIYCDLQSVQQWSL